MTPQRGLAEQEEGAEQAPGQAEMLWGRSGVRLGYMVPLKARKKGAATLCHDCMFVFFLFNEPFLIPWGCISAVTRALTNSQCSTRTGGVLSPGSPRAAGWQFGTSQFSRFIRCAFPRECVFSFYPFSPCVTADQIRLDSEFLRDPMGERASCSAQSALCSCRSYGRVPKQEVHLVSHRILFFPRGLSLTGSSEKWCELM